ncbi:hypothetical protein PN498_25785 [Oscillatoria sp. CS-180]|uniref:hypothetical protein n=1 Tax=Oscillatoria sp. CS-180 TaxID=3021720 RepID=UPI00232DCF41|nr:hypothetical protein [Oscillatoria sp. CS-180]MDB9529427.1 hypothetical protein [Oscillatoria sp. CS-180]
MKATGAEFAVVYRCCVLPLGIAKMELSEFEHRVIDAMISGDPDEGVLRNQLCLATVTERNYTDVGVFAKLNAPVSAMRTKMTNRLIQTTPMVYLTHPKLPQGAQAMLLFHNALMSTLECLAFDEDWPEDESKFTVEPYGSLPTSDA